MVNPWNAFTNCETNLMLTWSENCFLVAGTVANQAPTFTITDTKLYAPAQDNAKLFEQLKSEHFLLNNSNWTINWNNYQFKITMQAQNRYLDFLTESSFQELNGLFLLSLEDINFWNSYQQYFLPTVEIKDYNVMIHGRTFFWSAGKKWFKNYDKNRKTATGQGDDYTIGYLLDYLFFQKYFKLIAIDLSKQQKLDADPKAIQQIYLLEI